MSFWIFVDIDDLLFNLWNDAENWDEFSCVFWVLWWFVGCSYIRELALISCNNLAGDEREVAAESKNLVSVDIFESVVGSDTVEVTEWRTLTRVNSIILFFLCKAKLLNYIVIMCPKEELLKLINAL